MKHRGLKFLSLLLTLAMVVGLMPGMGLTAYAAEETITINCQNDTLSAHGIKNKLGANGTYSDFGEGGYIAWGQFIAPSGKVFTKIEVYGEEKVWEWSGRAKIVSHDNFSDWYTSYNFTLDDAAPISQTVTFKVVNGSWDDETTADKTVTLNGYEGDTLKLTADQIPAVGTKPGDAYKAGSWDVTPNTTTAITEATIFTYTFTAIPTYTVTYDANGGSGEMKPTKVSKNDEGKYIYKVESCGFTAPDGKTFDFWKGSDDREYRVGGEYELTGDITLKAQWKEEKKPDSGEKKTSGGGSGFDLVFNIPGEDNSWEYVGGYAPQQAYRVSLAPMQGGSAALGLTTGESGVQMNVYPTTTVYVFPNAAQGYVLDKIVWSLIDGSASYDITEAKNFVMPAMDVVVYVTFQPLAS